MKEASQQQTIVASVNEQNLIAHTREMFSSKTTFISELLQNARRSGSTYVQVEYQGPETGPGGTLVVTDGGSGIDDFGKLIAIAESGWSDPEIASEDPFGMGFMAAVFAADRVCVQSKGQQISFTWGDVVSKAAIMVDDCPFVGGARVVLEGLNIQKPNIVDAIRRSSRGFGIDVIFDGEKQESPHRIGQIHFQETDVGLIHIPHIHAAEEIGRYSHVSDASIYCHGLPMAIGYDKYSGYAAVHIDHHRFRPRMPDRDCLIDQKDAEKAVHQAMGSLWRQFLSQRLTEMNPQDFATKYWHICLEFGLDDIINRIDYVPSTALQVVASFPMLNEWATGAEEPSLGITRMQVEAGEVIVVDASSMPVEDDHLFVIKSWLLETGAFLVNRQYLPKAHWIHSHLAQLDGEAPLVSGEIQNEGTFAGGWCSGQIRVYKDLKVTFLGKCINMSVPFVEVPDYDCHDATFFIPPSGTGGCTEEMLRQANTYQSDNDDFQESDVVLDARVFDRILGYLQGCAPEDTLLNCLNQLDVGGYENLRCKDFHISINDRGFISVTSGAATGAV